MSFMKSSASQDAWLSLSRWLKIMTCPLSIWRALSSMSRSAVRLHSSGVSLGSWAAMASVHVRHQPTEPEPQVPWRRRGQPLKERPKLCQIEKRIESWRCNQAIWDWTDRLFPDLSPTTSRNLVRTGRDEVVLIAHEDVPVYVEKVHPTVLRWDKGTDTLGLPAVNMKAQKGCTFDRVVIFGPQTAQKYLTTLDLSTLKPVTKAALYVGATRARHSVAFVVHRKYANFTP
jgi:hypothetical protein